jgi:hypothetical protein
VWRNFFGWYTWWWQRNDAETCSVRNLRNIQHKINLCARRLYPKYKLYCWPRTLGMERIKINVKYVSVSCCTSAMFYLTYAVRLTYHYGIWPVDGAYWCGIQRFACGKSNTHYLAQKHVKYIVTWMAVWETSSTRHCTSMVIGCGQHRQ